MTTTTDGREVSWNITDDQQYAVDAVERSQERAELVAWEQLDASYDAKRAGEFERRLDQLLSGGCAMSGNVYCDLAGGGAR